MRKGFGGPIVWLLLLLACTLSVASIARAQSSWSNGYAFRRAITIDHTKVPNTDQSNFPVLISGAYSYLATAANGGGVTNPNGYDIVFTSDAAGANPLPFERESYSASTGTIVYWVGVPTLSHTADTVIYMFYGNGGITSDPSNKTGVWDSNYVGVWHLNQSPTAVAPQMADSTVSANNATAQGTWSMGQQVAGKIGGSLNFLSGNSDYLSTANAFSSPGPGSETAQAWFKSTSTSGTKIIGYESPQTGTSSTGYDRQIWLGTDGKIYGGFYSCTYQGKLVSASTYNNGNWHQAVLTLDTGSQQAKLYVDGAQVGTTISCSGAQSFSGYFRVGGYGLSTWTSAANGYFNGTIDEARVSLVARSADWIATEYNNQSSPSTFYSLGAAVVNGAGGTSAPYISGSWPISGPVTTPVTILGANFGTTQGASTVTFNGTAGVPNRWSDSSILVSVPSTATSGNVVVTSSGGSSNPSSFTVTNALGAWSTSPTSGISGAQVTITGIHFGSAQGSSSVTLSGLNCSVVSWSDTSIAIVVPSGASSGPFTISVAGQSVSTPVFTVTQVPTGWLDQDIGAVGVAGSASYANGTFTVSGAGGGTLATASDGVHFVYQPLSGDGTIIARVASGATEAGVMIRETLDPGASNAQTLYYANGTGFNILQRTSTGASSSGYVTAQQVSANPPYWVKLVRAGSTFTGYVSSDARYWIQIGSSQTISMAQNVFVGFFVTSRNTSALSTATFDGVSVSSAGAPAPLITGIAPTTVSIGGQVILAGSGFGASQNGSQVTLNNQPMTVNSWTDTAIVITVPTGATTGPLLVSAAASMNNSNGVILQVTAQPLPTAWSNTDIGLVGVNGSATFANGTFTLKGGGGGTLVTASDGIHFVYQPLSGDGTIVARLSSIQGGAAEAGVMIRETLDPGASNAQTLYYANGTGFNLVQRTSTNAASSGYVAAQQVSANPPYWIKLVRSGSSFSGYASQDGRLWTQIGSSQTIAMAQTVYVGLFVSNRSTSSLATATFDSVSLNSSSNPAPVITGISATTGSPGGQVVVTGSNFGVSQGGSVVVLNGTPTNINAWSSTSIAITIPAGATSGNLMVSVAPDMNYSNPVAFTVTANPLPSGWLDSDIGSVGVSGGASYSNGIFTASGAGGGTLVTSSDGLHLVYQSISGDGTILAHLASVQGGALEAGVMIRETLDSGASNAQTLYYGTGFNLVQRTSTNATSSGYLTAQQVAANPPYWVKLTRAGNTFTSYASPDGVYWTQIGSSQTISMAPAVYVGLFVTNRSTTSLATVAFDSVSLTAGTPVNAPVVTSATPSAAGVGYSITISGSGFGATQGSSQVYFNGTAASSVTSWSDAQIVATVPSSASTGPVTAVVNGIGSNRTVSLTIYNLSISSLTPPAAQTGGTITITGSGFGANQNSSTVSFNGVNASTLSWSNTSITVTVPSSATTGPVVVTEGGVPSNSVPFTVLEPLSVSGISPTSGPIGTTVTITGAGFGPTQSNSVVSFYGAYATSITSWSDTQIVATVPAGASSGAVGVTVAQQSGWGPAFTITNSVQVTDSLGNPSTYNSAIVGGKWVPTTSQGSGCSSCTIRGTISSTYDNNGNVLTRTDELNRTTTYTYDTSNNVLSVSVPYNGTNLVTSYTYNNFGEVLTTTDPLGNVMTNTYDTNGNLTKVTTPVPSSGVPASVTQFGYNTLGQLISITDPLNNLTNISYTAAGLIYQITDMQNNVTTYGYDAHGNRTSVTDALNHTTTFAYDSGDRLQTITYPGNTGTTVFGYDYRGRRISVTDQNSKTTAYAYDDADRLGSVTDAATPANVTSYGYDTENNLISITDANNHTTNFSYDAFGRVTQTTFPSNAVETYSYDAVGNLTGKTDRKNQSITYTYDQLNRLSQKQYPDNSTVNYTYDNDSRLTEVTDPTGTYSFTFDNMGRLTGTSTQYAFLSSRTFTTAYGYDAASNRSGFTDPEGGSTGYAYDTLNRLQTLTPPAAISGGSFGFSYDALSRRTSLTRPNAVNTTYGYDNLSRLLSVIHANSGTTIDGASYTLDNAGNRTAKTDQRTAVATSYGYDNIYQLLSATPSSGSPESYTYDTVGNRLSSAGVPSYSYNSSNELTSNSVATYGYDLNGNSVTKNDTTGITTYAWDFENRLTSVTLPGSGGTVSFAYDPFGRRIKKVSSAGTSVFAYDGDNLVEESNASGGVLARYSQGLNIDETLAMLRSSTTSYYQADGLGSVTSLSNGAGSLAQTYSFDSFGKTTPTGSLVNPFQYTGRESDSETGLYYYRARYYDPALGRFLSEDPIGFSAAENFYNYVDNEPTDFADPAGLCPQKKRPCPAKLPRNPRRRTMVATVLGEETGEGYVGSNQYGDDQSGNVKDLGGPEGPVITDQTLDLEAQLLASTMLNLGHIGNSGTYLGLPRGRGLAIKGLKSPEGSPFCKMLQRAIGAVDAAMDSPVPLSPFGQWRSVQQGNWVRPKGSALRIANTDFF